MPMPAAPRSAAAERRHGPLADEILNAGHLRTKSGKRKSRSDENEADQYLDAKTSRRILQIGQDLAEEDEAERRAAVAASRPPQANPAFDFDSRFDVDEEVSEGEDNEKYNNEEEWGDEEDEIIEEAELDPNDLDMFHKFIPRGDEDPIFNPGKQEQQNGGGTSLADLILEKIAAHEAAQSGEQQVIGGGTAEDAVEIPMKALDVFQKVGFLLSRYKSGPLPKPFKILPTLPHWQTLLSITQPEKWTSNSVYAATRIFISAKPQVAQEFIDMVLLERVREEIRETKKLHVHVYNALKKALYKPACFFKGFLFPLVASSTCTLREAHIVSSVITRVSIPVLHSAAALLRLCDLAAEQTSSTLSSETAGATNMFIKVFLEKKYALPYKVIDALVFHFLRFRAVDPLDSDTVMDSESASKAYKLPVIWHQGLLAFAQRYRNDITEDQREALLDLLLARGHKDIGPEVRRELLAGRGRGIPAPSEDAELGNGGDDTMDMDV